MLLDEKLMGFSYVGVMDERDSHRSFEEPHHE
jgi:hypothetical protein